MITRFRSSASGDLILLGPDAERVLRAMGREPAPQGIVEAVALAAAIAALRGAIEAEAPAADDEEEQPQGREASVSLRRRAWPVLEMLERARAADVPVVWGV